MRTIKFRGKDCVTNRWHFGNFITFDYSEVKDIRTCDSLPLEYRVKPETVGQFTGLCDVNGKEIYEGDIIEDNNVMSVVKWSEPYASFIVEQYEPDCKTYKGCDSLSECVAPLVVGNIFDYMNDKNATFRKIACRFLKSNNRATIIERMSKYDVNKDLHQNCVDFLNEMNEKGRILEVLNYLCDYEAKS